MTQRPVTALQRKEKEEPHLQQGGGVACSFRGPWATFGSEKASWGFGLRRLLGVQVIGFIADTLLDREV